MGNRDAHARTALAMALVVVALFAVDTPALKIILALVAAVLATTGFLRYCPLYVFMHKRTDTTEVDEADQKEAAAESATPSAPEAHPSEKVG